MLVKETALVSDNAPIVLTRINHGFGSIHVLKEFSYSFELNKVTAVLGKSGSGKSTLLQIINGMVKPDHGEIVIFGKCMDYANISSLRLQMGYVVQQVGLFPHMNVESNISLLGKVSHQAKGDIYNRVVELLDMVQLPMTCLKKYPNELSGGEQQRVGLCRSMLLNPPVLLMDEPFASLDYQTKRGIYKYVKAIQKSQPRTIIIVTHDWDEAATLADQFIWIEDGKIKDAGDHPHLMELKQLLFSES